MRSQTQAVAHEPEKLETYEKLTAAVNRAKALEKESAELQREAERLAGEIEELAGETSTRIG